MVARWLGDRPPAPDPKGLAVTERVQDELIREVEAHVDQLIETAKQQSPALAARVEAAARRRKLELERELILRRNREAKLTSERDLLLRRKGPYT